MPVALDELREYVDGQWSAPSEQLGITLEDPNTGSPIAPQLASSQAAVEAAIAAAARVHDGGSWSATSAEERAQVLEAIADAVEPLNDRIADLESLNTGAVRQMTGMLGVIVSGAYRLAAMQLRAGVLLDDSLDGPTGRKVEVHRRAVGPALCLVPWNAPAPMTSHKVASALAAGCPVILKPTEWAPYGSTLLATAIAQVLEGRGLPPGLFQVVQGGAAAGARVVEDPRVRAVSFTGGLSGGRAIASACAPQFKPAQLELGGNNPLVILEDATAEAAAQAVCDLMTTLNGQWCRALGWLIVPESRAGELLDAIFDRLAKVRIGSSLDLDSDMGPMVHSAHLAHLRERLEGLVAAGGTAHAPSDLPELPGNFFAPTLVTGVSPADMQMEIFGPVATLHTYKTDDEAVALANATDYGLEAYVVGSDEERALAVARRIRAGGVKVNGTSPLSLNLMAPRPSWGLSGIGVEGTIETITFFTGQQVVGVENSLPAQ